MRDTVDMRGIPFVDKDGRTRWAVPAEFPKPGTKGIWLLDEANAAHPQVQVVAYQLTHDRMVGEYPVPDDWVVVLAGNYESDGAVVHKMSSALSSRVIHLDLEADLDDWCAWAGKNGIEPMVIGFVRFRPELMHQFDKKDRAFPCPRTWEFVSDIIKAKPDPSVENALFEGTIGKGAAAELSGFVRLYRELPSIDDLIANPKTAKLPTEIAAKYAVAAALGRKANVKNFANVITYLERLPEVEFNVMAVKDAVARDTELRSTAVFGRWCQAHSDVTLGVAA
jgi:hypothetical protein